MTKVVVHTDGTEVSKTVMQDLENAGVEFETRHGSALKSLPAIEAPHVIIEGLNSLIRYIKLPLTKQLVTS